MKAQKTQLHGLLVVDKPEGPTSTACLNTLKREHRQKKIGHAGTLDPMATGILLVMLGQATKIAPYLSGEYKVYSGQLKLGRETDTYDRQGKCVGQNPWQHLTEEEVRKEVLAWSELKTQIVPPVSAAKHKGTPLYTLQRRGQEVPVKEKPIQIFSVELILVQLPFVTFRVTCSQGTYIRSLAHSLGKRLGCGAILTALRRECCHPFCLNQAVPFDTLAQKTACLREYLIPLDQCLPHWPRKILPPPQEKAIRNGMRLPVEQVGDLPPDLGTKAFFLDSEGRPLALAQCKEIHGRPHWASLRGLWQDNIPD